MTPLRGVSSGAKVSIPWLDIKLCNMRRLGCSRRKLDSTEDVIRLGVKKKCSGHRARAGCRM